MESLFAEHTHADLPRPVTITHSRDCKPAINVTAKSLPSDGNLVCERLAGLVTDSLTVRVAKYLILYHVL